MLETGCDLGGGGCTGGCGVGGGVPVGVSVGVAVGVLVGVSVGVGVGFISQSPGIIFNSLKFQDVLSNGARTHSFINVVLV
jgi:hypothetical protein